MQNIILKDVFTNFRDHLNTDQELREKIRVIVRTIDQSTKDATITLQIIHSSITGIANSCQEARLKFDECREGFSKIEEIVPAGQYYRYCDHWHYLTQRLVFLVSLTIYLEVGTLVSRETVAEILGLKTSQSDGFHLDIEDYLMGLLQLATELSRFATNSVTLGDYERPILISKFVSDLNAGFRLLNLKNDSLRKRFDALKYDVKKIEEVVYDISIRGLRPAPPQLSQVSTPEDAVESNPKSD